MAKIKHILMKGTKGKNNTSANADICHWTEVPDLFAPCGDIPGRILAEKNSRPDRILRAFLEGAASTFGGRDRQLFDLMMVGEDLAALNEELAEDLRRELDELKREEADPDFRLTHGHYSLTRSTQLISFYYTFGFESKHFPGRLDPETEALLLETIWERTKYKNDIAEARTSTWWLSFSENHDIHTKVCNLLSSQIFAGRPEYQDRIYPDLGYGANILSHGGDFTRADAFRMKGGRASLADGRNYCAKDHQEAWEVYWKAFFRERARRGFFLENGACGYMRYTVGFLLCLHNFCEDEELKRICIMFFDVFWLDWAVQSMGGMRGGPKVRYHTTVGGYDSLTEWAMFYAGGSGKSHVHGAQQLIGDYEWPEVVWQAVLRPKPEEGFTYIARAVGEEEDTFPRPRGRERAMLGDCESRMVKVAWVTPDHILGTQMDHPYALYNHLAVTGRWQGLITCNPDVRLATVSLREDTDRKHKSGYSLELLCRSVQDRGTLITQQQQRWLQASPDWFPTHATLLNNPMGVHIGAAWERVVEEKVWVFLEAGNTLVAIRVLLSETDSDPLAWAKGTSKYMNQVVLREDAYHWNDDRSIICLNHNYSPVIIEIARRCEFASFLEFQKRVLAHPIEVFKTMVTGETDFIVRYKGLHPLAREIVFNGASPSDAILADGLPIDYQPRKLFDSPFFESEYGSGVMTIRGTDGDSVWDFNSGEIGVPQ